MLIDLPQNIKKAFKMLKKAQSILNDGYSGFSFTLDGKLIGDIGEAIIQERFKDSIKLKDSAKGHDIVLTDGTNVQIKTTQRNVVGMGLNKQSY